MATKLTWPRRLEVFSSGTSDAQIVWRSLGSGPVTIERDGAVVAKGPDATLGAAVVEDLEPGSRAEVVVRPADGAARRLAVETLPPPGGAELCRFATLSDLHLGATSFGLAGLIKERPDLLVDHPDHCARAAVADATAWGAEALYLKGDLTHHAEPEHWERAGRFIASLPLPHRLILGNHDVQYDKQPAPASSMAQVGLERERFAVVDHPGLRVVLVDFSVDGRGTGVIGAEGEQLLEAAAVDRPLLVATHFHFHRHVMPWFWPLGIWRRSGGRLLRALRDVNPNVVVTSGHTHRTRSHPGGVVPLTEVGSPKDYPGVWGGYVVHEGGLVQVVRRVSEPSAMAWTDRTRRAVGGVWGLWSPGAHHDRSVVVRWN